jgi:hypothetical protein
MKRLLDRVVEIAKVAALDNNAQARSSVGEHYLDTVGVGGSIPPVPTTPESAADGLLGSTLPSSSESRAKRCAECYSAQPLNTPHFLAVSGSPVTARGSAIARPSRPETMNRE